MHEFSIGLFVKLIRSLRTRVATISTDSCGLVVIGYGYNCPGILNERSSKLHGIEIHSVLCSKLILSLMGEGCRFWMGLCHVNAKGNVLLSVASIIY